MRLVGRNVLDTFRRKYPDSEQALRAWHAEVKNARWHSPNEVKAKYGSASIVGGNRVVFNICGNKYRLVVKLNYGLGIAQVRYVGTHAEYDRINVETV
jgi:mRNA interferase HigB